MRRRGFWFGILWLLISSGWANAQDVVVHGGFLVDSLGIGDIGGYYLTARYPSARNILFPDSTFNFAPFEYERRHYSPTVTHNGISYDSVVYYVSTFEVDKIQTLSLPVLEPGALDTATYVSPRDTIRLVELVKVLPDTLAVQNLPLKTNTAYELVPFLFNYPVLLIVLAILLVLAVGGWLLFGKRIRKYYRLKRMEKAYQKFAASFSNEIEQLRQTFSPARTEQALVAWKRYMEQLEMRPYTKLTARETMRMAKNESLGMHLKTIDGAIYGHNTQVVEPLEQLKDFAHGSFTRKIQEVKHG